MGKSGASWTATVHHLKHLEENSLVTKERITNPGYSGPRLLYRSNPRLAELRELGWIPDSLGNPSS